MARVLIAGASRGIGLEFARQYRAEGWSVVASARDTDGEARLQALGAQPFRLDVTDSGAPDVVRQVIGAAPLDVAIYNAGVSGDRKPALDAPAASDFDSVMRTNVLGAMTIGPVLLGALARATAKPGRLAVLSSRMGSIGARSDNSNWLYRASKAALNSVLKDLSLAAAGTSCIALHPGWVRTDMGGGGADIDVTASVTGMRAVLGALSGAGNGGFFNFDGTPIPW